MREVGAWGLERERGESFEVETVAEVENLCNNYIALPNQLNKYYIINYISIKE